MFCCFWIRRCTLQARPLFCLCGTAANSYSLHPRILVVRSGGSSLRILSSPPGKTSSTATSRVCSPLLTAAIPTYLRPSGSKTRSIYTFPDCTIVSEDHWGLVLGHRHDGITLVYRSMFPVAATPGATYWFETGVVFPATFNDSVESTRGVRPSSKSREEQSSNQPNRNFTEW